MTAVPNPRRRFGVAPTTPEDVRKSPAGRLLDRAEELLLTWGPECGDEILDQLEAEVKADAGLRAYANRLAAEQALEKARYRTRRPNYEARQPARPQYTPEQQRRVRRFTEGIFFHSLFGGKPLGDATRADLLDSIARYRKQMDGFATECRFQELVLAKMEGQPEGKRVREVLTADELRAMQERARQEGS